MYVSVRVCAGVCACMFVCNRMYDGDCGCVCVCLCGYVYLCQTMYAMTAIFRLSMYTRLDLHLQRGHTHQYMLKNLISHDT